jgi:hypothetical protein
VNSAKLFSENSQTKTRAQQREELLLTGFTDHAHVGGAQVTVFLGVGINSFLRSTPKKSSRMPTTPCARSPNGASPYVFRYELDEKLASD